MTIGFIIGIVVVVAMLYSWLNWGLRRGRKCPACGERGTLGQVDVCSNCGAYFRRSAF
jgi:hypothetical protein